ncbi:OmpA family protein [Stieleria maiorica]|uniref:OmpA family protein n=1 Tax=Stieleria maiorica TaxID=2795974 RepID=A0A5B9MED6_9BACT|nr:OmpA family protein [Stieleria maiorica]QEF97934.1 OmpA family protein [Stieleria maiorica]
MSDGIVDERSVSPPAALLADFGFDDDKLKSNHKAWLESAVVDRIRSVAMKPADGYWEIRLEGAASQIGSDGYNLQLSQRRADQVQNYIRGRLAGHPLTFRVIPRGESVPVDPAVQDNAWDRAVAVIVTKYRLPKPTKKPKKRKLPPTKIPKVIPPIPKTKSFSIQVISGEAESLFSLAAPTGLAKGVAKRIAKRIGASAKFVEKILKKLPFPNARFGLLALEVEVEIVDKLFKESARYTIEHSVPYCSGGITGAPKKFEIRRGDKATFTDLRAIEPDDFAGDAFLSIADERFSFGKPAKGRGFRHSRVDLDFRWMPNNVIFGDVGAAVDFELS